MGIRDRDVRAQTKLVSRETGHDDRGTQKNIPGHTVWLRAKQKEVSGATYQNRNLTERGWRHVYIREPAKSHRSGSSRHGRRGSRQVSGDEEVVQRGFYISK